MYFTPDISPMIWIPQRHTYEYTHKHTDKTIYSFIYHYCVTQHLPFNEQATSALCLQIAKPFFCAFLVVYSFWFIIHFIYRNKKNHSYLLLISLLLTQFSGGNGTHSTRLLVLLTSMLLLLLLPLILLGISIATAYTINSID